METPEEAARRVRERFRAGEADQALQEGVRALETWPSHAGLRAAVASVRAYRGDLAQARADVEEALRLDPACVDAYLTRLYMSKEPADVLADAKRVLELQPGNLPALYWQALSRSALGESEGVHRDIHRVASAEVGDDAFLLQYRALAKATLRAFAGALHDFNRVVELGVRLPETYRTRADMKTRLRDFRGAAEDLTLALERRPEDVALLVARGRVRISAGDLPGATADLNRVIERDPTSIPAHYYRALARAGLDPEAAREDQLRASSLEPSDSEGYYFRGLAREALDRAGEAAADFARARELCAPSDPRRADIEERTGGPKRESPFKALLRSPATWVVAAANVAVWIAQGDYATLPKGEALLRHGALERTLVWNGEYWRLFTAMVLHVGPIHLAWNTYGTLAWCAPVERRLGPWRFLVGYVLSGLGASAASLLGHHVISAGSSGALFGVLGMVLYMAYAQLGSWRLFFSFPPVRSVLVNVGLWFVLGMTLLPMDNYAHFGGMAVGFLTGWLFLSVPAYRRRARVACWAAALLGLAGTLGAACLPWYR